MLQIYYRKRGNTMKHLGKVCLYKICNLCIAFSVFFYWRHVSYVLFGELPYPTED